MTLGAGAATGAFANAPRVEAPFGRRPCEIAANEPAGLYRLVEADDPSGPAPAPGQFYMLAAQAGWGGESGRPHLARAFSVCRVRGSRLAFLVDPIGPGTEILAALAPGARLWLAGPLGAGFTAPAPGTDALLAGGGVGLAPLVALADALAGAGHDWQTVLGFRSAAHAAAAALLPADAALATDDGSAGHHGLVTELLADELGRDGAREVYACGPPRMLEAVRALCEERAVPAQLALEEAMACGFGACFGCVVATRSGYRRICVDGPVLPAAELDPAWLEHSA